MQGAVPQLNALGIGRLGGLLVSGAFGKAAQNCYLVAVGSNRRQGRQCWLQMQARFHNLAEVSPPGQPGKAHGRTDWVE